MEHVFRQLPGIGVVARAMVAVGEEQAAGKVVEAAVAEFPGAFLLPEGRKHRSVGQGAERQ